MFCSLLGVPLRLASLIAFKEARGIFSSILMYIVSAYEWKQQRTSALAARSLVQMKAAKACE